jgi:hypothetical protein
MDVGTLLGAEIALCLLHKHNALLKIGHSKRLSWRMHTLQLHYDYTDFDPQSWTFSPIKGLFWPNILYSIKPIFFKPYSSWKQTNSEWDYKTPKSNVNFVLFLDIIASLSNAYIYRGVLIAVISFSLAITSQEAPTEYFGLALESEKSIDKSARCCCRNGGWTLKGPVCSIISLSAGVQRRQ